MLYFIDGMHFSYLNYRKFQNSDLTPEKCLSIIEKYEPNPEARKKNQLQIDGSFVQSIKTFLLIFVGHFQVSPSSCCRRTATSSTPCSGPCARTCRSRSPTTSFPRPTTLTCLRTRSKGPPASRATSGRSATAAAASKVNYIS